MNMLEKHVLNTSISGLIFDTFFLLSDKKKNHFFLMVRGLSDGIYNSISGKSPEVEMSKIPHQGKNLSFVIDGISLCYLIVTNKDPDHGWEYASGGDYELYAKRMINFFKVLKSANAHCLIVFPLADGTPPVSDALVTKWTNSANETIRRINRTRQFIEKDYPAKNLLEVLPQFIIDLVVETAGKLRIPVVYTRHNVVRFVARFVASGEADAVIGQDTDYILFRGVKYIPIDSIYHNDSGVLCCDYIDSTFVKDAVGLNEEKYLFDLSCLLGNACTEHITDKYNMYVILHCKPDPEDPTLLIDTIVDFLNKDTFQGSLELTNPFKDIISSDQEFKKAIDEAREFYDISADFPKEGDSFARIEVEKGRLPLWSVALDEGSDMWIPPIMDDYREPVSTIAITRPYRQIMYGILGRRIVIEHFATQSKIVSKEIYAEEDMPLIEDLRKMKPEALSVAFYKIAHQTFPKPPEYETDPLIKFEEPVKTVGYALRYIVAQCFTRNSSVYTRTPSDNVEFREHKIISAPPIDYFELKALAAQALILMMINIDTYKAPEFLPKMRRVHVAALYQSVMAHMIWLQMFFGQKSTSISPLRLFNGQIFAACYNVRGEIGSQNFLNFFSEPEKIKTLESKRLTPFIKAILFPFPNTLFQVFEGSPRSVSISIYEANRVAPKTRIAFVPHINDDSEEEDIYIDDVPSVPKGNSGPPPPPSESKKKQKKVENSEDEDEQYAFLLAAASTNSAPRPVQVLQTQKKNKGPARRRVEKVDFNKLKQEFDKENNRRGKESMKREMKNLNIEDYE